MSTDEKAGIARENGCAHVIVTAREAIAPRVLELTEGRKLGVVYDSVGRDTFAASLDCLRPRIGTVRPLSEAVQAHEDLQARRTAGATVFTP